MTRREQLSTRQIQTLTTLVKACDTSAIKVLSGVRGSGKLTLLRRLRDTLEINGIAEDQIIEIGVEYLRGDTRDDSWQLEQLIEERIQQPDRQYYVLLNQINHISGWEKALYDLRQKYKISFYLTISCANWKSAAFTSLFGDDYLEQRLYPLSFSEYLQLNGGGGSWPLTAAFSHYLRYGSLLVVNSMALDDHIARSISTGIYNTILVNDLMRHNNIKDVPMFERLSQYMVRNIGVLGSPKSISDYFASIGYKIASETVANYMTALENAFVFHKIQRYDILAQRELKNRSKHYIIDTGLRHALTNRYDDVGFELENTVYFELLRRGYQVQIGKIGKGEIDFVARKDGQVEYYQVSLTISRHETFYAREYEPLLRVRDTEAKKIILSMDAEQPDTRDGIQFRNLLEFLCEE